MPEVREESSYTGLTAGSGGADGPLDAGNFSEWLKQMQRAMRGKGGTDVPCGGCTACCRSSQFVHIEPDETETLRHIPAGLLFPAPQLPPGHVVLGYDQRGHCPMLTDNGCSIYRYRPRTCRTFDCRVFTAADVMPDPAQRAVSERVRLWRFRHDPDVDGHPADVDPEVAGRAAPGVEVQAAVSAAAKFLREHQQTLGGPRHPAAIALAAVEVHRLFLHPEGSDWCDPELPTVRAALEALRAG